MIFSNLRHDNCWSRDNFSNQITDADNNNNNNNCY